MEFIERLDKMVEDFKALLLNDEVPETKVIVFCLKSSVNIICEIRNTEKLEWSYEPVAVQMALEIYSKLGAEGQTSHSENGISRTYDSSDISKSLLSRVTPVVKTPFTLVRRTGCANS